MRLGLLGPLLGDDVAPLRRATELLLEQEEAVQVIYLGEQSTYSAFSQQWARDLAGGDERPFLERAAELAIDGSPDALEALLAGRDARKKLHRLRALPPAPALAVEMLGDRIVLLVHDKDSLDAEDIANAGIVVFGHAPESMLKRFGPRYFFSPGPAESGFALLDVDEEGQVVASTFDLEGRSTFREILHTRRSKVSVSG